MYLLAYRSFKFTDRTVNSYEDRSNYCPPAGFRSNRILNFVSTGNDAMRSLSKGMEFLVLRQFYIPTSSSGFVTSEGVAVCPIYITERSQSKPFSSMSISISHHTTVTFIRIYSEFIVSDSPVRAGVRCKIHCNI